MNYTQEEVDRSFEAYRETRYHSKADVERIRNVIRDTFGITLSNVQVIEFWSWRSEEWFAGWLIVGPDAEIVRWFTVWMDWYSRGFKGLPLKEEHANDPILDLFCEDDGEIG